MKKTLTSTLLTSIIFFATAQHTLTSEQILEKGNQLQEDKKRSEAISLYKMIHESDSNYYRGLYEMSSCYYADSQYTKALEISTKGIAVLSDQRASFMNLHANILDDMGETEKAFAWYDSAMRIYPSYISPYLNYGTLLMKKEKFKEAESFLQKASFVFPFSPGVHYKLGIASINQGNLIQGFLSISHSVLVDPEGNNVKNAVSVLSSMAKGDDDMLEYYNKRKSEPSSNYQLVEEMLVSRLALDKKFKISTDIEDAITRQYQMIIEKLEYRKEDNDFYVQYYLPNLKAIYVNKQFDAYCNYMFSGLDIAQIKTYLKKNKKEVNNLTEALVAYFNRIRVSRAFFAHERTTDGPWHYENGVCIAKGKYEKDKPLGNWEFFYVNGNIKSRGNFDDAGKRTGEWIYYHDNSNISGKENYSNGELQGSDVEYHANGNISRNASFVKGAKQGENHDYYASGILKSIVVFDKGKESGALKYYYPQGPEKTIINAVNGEINGKMLKYYLNGRMESESNYVAGKLDGKFRSWHDNGNLYAEGVYENDKQTGTWKYYHENGKLKSVQQYVSGEVEGEQNEFHDNGQLSYKQVFRKAKPDGETSYYTRDGKIFSKLSFSNGKLKEAAYYDLSGKEISKTETRGKSFDLDVYRPDGTKRSTARYNDKGVSEGVETQFWSSGAILSKLNYVNGSVAGTGTFYFNNGKVEQQLNYSLEGEKNGLFQEFYKHGGILAEGFYKSNQMEGVWNYYNESGQLRERIFFVEGEKDGIRESYYRNGQVEFREEYVMGSLVSATQYDTSGKVLGTHVWPAGNGKFNNRQLNGNIYAESTLKNGFLHGAYTSYFFDGKVFTKEFYYYGENDSSYQVYYHNGKLQQEGKYYRGDKEGPWVYYNDDGSVYLKEEYVLGKLHGKRTFYFENGKPETETIYFHGRKEGWYSRYSEDGMLISKIRYSDDLMMEYTYEGKNGELVKPIPLPGGNGKMTTYFRNGSPASSVVLTDGDLNGEIVYYHSNGKISWQAKEDFNLTEGPATSYYSNGQAKEKFIYLHNEFNGQYRFFYPDGKLKKEGNYFMDQKHGEWISYAKDGRAEEKSIYYYGRLLNTKKL